DDVFGLRRVHLHVLLLRLCEPHDLSLGHWPQLLVQAEDPLQSIGRDIVLQCLLDSRLVRHDRLHQLDGLLRVFLAMDRLVNIGEQGTQILRLVLVLESRRARRHGYSKCKGAQQCGSDLGHELLQSSSLTARTSACTRNHSGATTQYSSRTPSSWVF